jgi:transposase InsO family protein
MLEDRRTNKNNPKVNIESLLSDADGEDWGHQYSDNDLKEFAKELGLDYSLESKREY